MQTEIVLDQRMEHSRVWAKSVLGYPFVLTPVSGDASFRRYFRLSDGDHSLIVMDAPPELEAIDSFLNVQKRLYAQGVRVPEVIATNLENGFVLLEDFGDRLYQNAVQEGDVDRLYDQALQALLELQHVDGIGLPDYDERRLNEEMDLFKIWFLDRHMNCSLSFQDEYAWQQTKSSIMNNILNQPVCLVHRDYHCRNLFELDDKTPGIIDFQDAVNGPITYDLISLLRDAYVEWPEKWVESKIDAFYHLFCRSGASHYSIGLSEFRNWVEWMGLQRHLKVLGIFCRLNYRDHKPGYMKHLPLVLKYVLVEARRCLGQSWLVDVLGSPQEIEPS